MSDHAIRICLIGQKFMGRAHSNAYLKVDKFFNLPRQTVMQTICARNAGELETFRQRWGWAKASTDWKSAIADPEIDLVDVTTPNSSHLDMCIAALEAGKHVACEKPLAGTLAEARQMRDAAKKAKKCKSFVWYSYRRVPAVTLAHQLVKEGRLGRIYHVRAYYLQDWAAPEVPLIWRFQKKIAGSGAHGDLGAHIIDMARFITGDEITEVTGAIAETFVKERAISEQESDGGITGGAKSGKKMGKVDVDDSTIFIARFKGGAIGTFEATRMASGYQNKNGVEIHGEKGSISVDFENLSWLNFFDRTEERKVRGWHRINVSHGPEHPYAANWWPDAHSIGYEHTFINQAADMLSEIAGKPGVTPVPDFADAYKTQEVLEAAVISAAERRPVKIAELK
jgi:predicted dehydrogenase